MHRQAATVAQPSVGADLDEAADVLVDFPPQVTFGEVLPVNYFPDAVDLSFAKLVHSGRNRRVKVRLGQDFSSYDRPYAVNPAQGHVRSLSVRYIHTSYSDHRKPPEI
jgi:hypothetical protein